MPPAGLAVADPSAKPQLAPVAAVVTVSFDGSLMVIDFGSEQPLASVTVTV